MDSKTKSLKTSVVEGAFANAMIGFTQDYFAPFLLALGGTVQQIGLLNALPNLAASLAQLKSVVFVDYFGSRKKAINTFVFLQAIVLIPMAFLAFHGIERSFIPCGHSLRGFIFIGLVILFTCFGALASPAWGSLMSDLVEPDKRGRYFGWRNRVLGFILVGATFTAGCILQALKKIDVFKAFAFLFAAAFIWRMISWHYLRKMYEPPLHNSPDAYFSLFQFLRRLKDSNFAKFVVFAALMSFSVNMASPFFAVFMLKSLKFSYLLYTVVTLTATLTIYSAIARWGHHADQAGNLKVIRATAPLIGVIPLLWLVNQNPVYLIGAQIFSGFLWAGFNLCTSNFIYDAVIPEKRTRCIAYFNALNGSALCCGAVAGGFLLPHLPPVFGHKILTLFMISSFLRITVALSLPRYLKEVRPVQHIKSDQLFFSMIGIRPMIGAGRKTAGF